MKTFNNKIFIASIVLLGLSACEKDDITYETASVADFSTEMDEFEVNEVIQFTDQSVPEEGNQIVSWEWDFGDDNIPESTEQNPTVEYTEESNYDVTLTISDNHGLKSSTIKTVSVIDPTNNVQMEWSSPIAEAIQNTVSPVLSPDGTTVYMVADRSNDNGDLELFAYNTSDGSRKWKFNLDVALSSQNEGGNPRLVYASPSVGADGSVYLPIRDLQSPGANRKSFLFAINPDGTEKWNYGFGYDANLNYITPAIDQDGYIYVGGLTNTPFKIAVLDPATGEEVKTIDLPVGVRSGLAISKAGDVYFGSTGANGIFSYNNTSLSQNFNAVPEGLGSTGGGFSIGEDGTVYTTANMGQNGGVIALNPDGSEKWIYNTSGTIDFGGVAIGSDGSIYAPGGRVDPETGLSDGLVALNADGSLKWKFETEEPVTNVVPLIDNREYVHFITDSGTYYVIKNDAIMFGSLKLGERSTSSPVMDENGLVYIGVEKEEGMSELISINSKSQGPSDSAWPMKGQNSRRTHFQK